MKVLLVYPPFCTPATPPYSLTRIYSFLKNNSGHEIEVLDLNLEFHKMKFPESQKYFQQKNWKDYDEITKKYQKDSFRTYSKNNKLVLAGKKPELFKELLKKIKEKKPDLVAFSIVYSSQSFYAHSIIGALENIKTVIGGPAVNKKLIDITDKYFKDEIEFLKFLGEKTTKKEIIPDFSIYNLKEYFTPFPVIPIKTSNTCYYKQCAFCTHFAEEKYCEYDLDFIKKTIINSEQKHFFLIDDMIPARRLLELSKIFKPLNIKWTCQLKPTKDFDFETLKKLKESGLVMIMWGVESGSQRILDLIKKGTKINDIKKVLSDSHKAGIKNIAYIIFGFPTETKKEFLDTIAFLEENSESIDLVSTSVFGLHKGTEIYNNPSKFGITKIIEEKRTMLDSKISYKVEKGLTQKQAVRLRDNYKKTIENIDKFPHKMNFFREHMLCLL